jgi:membrane protease YdiL (CAAX protease family)
MFNQLSDLSKALIFYDLVFTLVVGVALMPLGQIALPIAMMMPTVAVLLMLLVVTRDGYSRAGWSSLGLQRAGIKLWPLAVLAPLGVLGAASLVVWNTGVASFNPPLLDAMGWVSGLSESAFQGIIIATFTFSLGEELGWRGYLLPKLAATLGDRRGMVVTGLLHGLFHMPILFLTPYYHADGNRWLIVPLFLTAVTVGGMLFGYLRLQTNSVWPASLAHSAHNYFWAVFTSLTLATSPVAAEYLAGESGILPIIGYGLLATWLFWRMRPRRTSVESGAAVVRAGGVAQPAS